MIFHEIYSLYYKTVTCLIQSSFTHVNEIINENAFKESFMMLEEALERWPIKNIDVSTYPLTLLQKRWLKAISLDPRMQLFSYSWSFLDDVEPLFTPMIFISLINIVMVILILTYNIRKTFTLLCRLLKRGLV